MPYLLLGLLEQVPHSRRSDSHKQLDELTRRAGEERHPGLPGHRSGQQRLSGTGWPDQERPLGHLGPQLRVLLAVFQEIDDLPQLQLGALDSGHVIELDAGIGYLLKLGLALVHGVIHAAHAAHSAHTTHAAASLAGIVTSVLVQQKEQPSKCQDREDKVSDQQSKIALLVTLAHTDVHPVLGEDVHQIRIVG